MGVIEDLHKEHSRIVQLLYEIAETSERPTPEVIQGYFDDLQAVFAEHLRKEAETVYATVALERPSEDLARSAAEDHQAIEGLIDVLSKMSPAERSWAGTLHELRTLVSEHIRGEERTLFPIAEGYWQRQSAAGQ